jgi:hypothetical protein
MDLLHGGQLGEMVAIASSDADFAPLALRLREAGLRVVCYAQAEKSADTRLGRCYDSVVYLGDARPAELVTVPAPAPVALQAPARKAATPPQAAEAPPPPAPAKPARKSAPAPKPPKAKPEPKAEPKPKKAKTAKAAKGKVPPPDPAADHPDLWAFLGEEEEAALPSTLPSEVRPDPVRALLDALPGFAEGREIELGEVVQQLRAARLLGKNASGPAFLQREAPYVQLTPAKNPHKLRFVGWGDRDDEIPF